MLFFAVVVPDALLSGLADWSVEVASADAFFLLFFFVVVVESVEVAEPWSLEVDCAQPGVLALTTMNKNNATASDANFLREPFIRDLLKLSVYPL